METSAATNPQTQKYVCCGSCKQWLAAPRDANLVYCPGCEAVNDCSLVCLLLVILALCVCLIILTHYYYQAENNGRNRSTPARRFV